MEDFEEPTYIFDFRDTLNCIRVEGAKPGQQLNVLVRKTKETAAPGTKALGIRSKNGDTFTIQVTTPEGVQSHDWTWEFLMDAIKIHRGTPAEPSR